MNTDDARHFLFLQGPHGPIFSLMARQLRTAGCRTSRVAFNAGDRMFRRGFDRLMRFDGSSEEWSNWLATRFAKDNVTDLVIYGTTRPVHAQALTLAKAAGITTHIFDEGYLRPWWVTYERSGSNATSRLMAITVDEMRQALDGATQPPAAAPARWGDTREHIFWGAVYHAVVMGGSLWKTPFPTHREPGVPAEAAIAIKHLALSPFSAILRARAAARMSRSGAPYHLVLLQLSHDANHRAASPYPTTEAYLEDVISSFAEGAPKHHLLVFKAHPLEDGRDPLRRTIKRLAKAQGLSQRVYFLTGSKLAPLLDGASSAVTINSTAAHQALWRGLPVKTLGTAPHAKPEFSASGDLSDFFAAPEPPDREAYIAFRQYLLATCQIPGGFYAARARRRLLRRATDLLLASTDTFDALKHADASAQQLSAVTPRVR